MTARIHRHRLRQRQRQRQRERERASARKRVLGSASGDSTWTKLQAKVSKGVSDIGKRATEAGKAVKRKAAKKKKPTVGKTAKPRQRLAASTKKPSTRNKSRAAATKKAPSRKGSTPKSGTSRRTAASTPERRRSGLLSLIGLSWPRRWWARCALSILLFTAIIGGTILLGIYVRYKNMAGQYDLRQIGRMPQESVVFDTYGNPFSRLHGDGRIIVPLEAIPPYFIDALIAREDTRFDDHSGIDSFGVMRALVRNAKEGGFAQGASTLTMQLARISFDMREKTVHRKLVEALLARRIEQNYSKDDILFYYVNRVFLGSGLYGVEAAARAHFGKPSSDMTLGEAAMLVGVIRAPNRFSPFRHYEAALRERDTVLGRMTELEMITQEQADAARSQHIHVLAQNEVLPADLRPMSGPGSVHEQRINASYLSEAVRSEIANLLDEEQQQTGGLNIYTSFDLSLQKSAEQSVENRLQAIEASPGYPHPTRSSYLQNGAATGHDPDYLQAAVTVIDNGNGAVRAMVGGRSFDDSRYNRSTQAHRQAGSIFKPLIYAIAFESGLFPGSLIDDGPIQSGEIAWDTTGWAPRNSDGSFEGWMPAEAGLIRSRNTMTVRVGETAGIDAVAEMARFAGLVDAAQPTATISPQIYIGNLGASLISLTSAYTAFANEGLRAKPYFIERIDDRRGNILYQRTPESYRVVSAGATWMTSQIMQKVMAPGGTGQSVAELGIDFPVAGKTGTTNDYHDAWFVGYSSSLSCGVWVGLDQPERIVDHGYGGRLALPIWSDIMLASRELRYPTMELPEADDVMTIELCRHSGLLSSEKCRARGTAYQEVAPHSMIPRHTCDHDGEDGARGVQPHRVRDSRESDPDEGLFGRLKGLFSDN